MATAGLRGNHVYDHLGVRSRRLGPDAGETRMPVTDDVRVPGGLRAAPLGLAFEQGVASYLFDRVIAVPIQIALHVRDRGDGVRGIRSETRLVRLGRSLVVTDGEIRDADDAGRLLAFGGIVWSVTGEARPRPADAEAEADADEELPFTPAGIDVVTAAGITPLADGSGCRVEGITPQTAGPGGILHAGMFQLLCEEAALVATRRATGARNAWAVDCTYDFLQAGKFGPFVATGDVLCAGDEGVDVRVTVRDQGNDDRVTTRAFVRVRHQD